MTNHKGQAEARLGDAERESDESPGTSWPNVIAMAQVHATLHLAEQQQTANLIAMALLESVKVPTPTDALDALYSRVEGHGFCDPAALTLRPTIRERLGI